MQCSVAPYLMTPCQQVGRGKGGGGGKGGAGGAGGKEEEVEKTSPIDLT